VLANEVVQHSLSLLEKAGRPVGTLSSSYCESRHS
jgi:hypothetical protein